MEQRRSAAKGRVRPEKASFSNPLTDAVGSPESARLGIVRLMPAAPPALEGNIRSVTAQITGWIQAPGSD